MMRGKFFNRLQDWSNHADAVLACGVIGVILLVMIPLPPILLDTFLCFSIVFSVITLLLTLYVENALEFSSFPSLLLFLTLYRLGLNIATTRMILSRCEGGDIIRTFGEFVIQNNTIVGMILFTLITIINFIVITKGAGRIAEVAARFTLEALPGKQMAIDGELASGILAHPDAKKAREKIAQEADFYGAMDGASKFVRGDAIASLFITVVNIVGGLAIGLTIKELSWQECWTTFTYLTIGDGLVSQIPALLVSTGAGIMVTRAQSGSLGQILTKQMFHHPKVLLIAASLVLILSTIPGMPIFVMLPIGIGLFLYAYLKFRKKEKKEERKQEQTTRLFAPLLEVQLGINAVYLAEPLSEKLGEIRKKVGNHLGIIVPNCQITDNLDLSPNGWKILVKGVTILSGREPELHQLSSHLQVVIEKNAYELINRQDVLLMVQEVKAVDSAVVEELIPHKLNIGHILKILQNLLKEGIPIRDLITIFEVLADHAVADQNPDCQALTEKVRLGLSKGISEEFFGKSRLAHVITLDPKVEQTFDLGGGKLRPKVIDQITRELLKLTMEASKKGIRAVVVTTTTSRANLRKIIEPQLPELPVLSYSEISHEVEMKKIANISNEVLI